MMAEGGGLGGSVKESDYLYEFLCFPCEKDGRNVEAIKFCADCAENLCATCLIIHKKFAITRGHKVLDQVQRTQGQTKQLPSQRCSKHGGKIIDVFCPKHDNVGCSTCISVDHSSCKGIRYIPDVAAGMKTSKELKQLKDEMRKLESKLGALKKRKGDNVQRLKQDKEELKKEIQSARKRMNEQLDQMEKELLHEAETKFQQKIDAVHASIAEVDAVLTKLKEAMDQVVTSGKNDADIFVSCKFVKQALSKEMHPVHTRVEERHPERGYELHTAENAQLILDGKMVYASIKEKYTIHGTDYKEDINIRASDDKQLCVVLAMCSLPDGCIVMSDYNNKKLKKLEPVSRHVSTLITLPDNPSCLCLVDKTRLAVCLINQKKIQFVSLLGKVTLDKSFSVGDRCRDVAHCDGLLYVCCGGSPARKEGRGHVEVYNCNGELLRCFYDGFGCPWFITVINDGNNTTLYTADVYKGVHARCTDGTVKHSFPTALRTDQPFCLIGTDQLCIGEYSTGNIYIQTYKDKRILVEKRNLIGNPLYLYFDEKSSRLFVALDNCDHMAVFDLNIE